MIKRTLNTELIFADIVLPWRTSAKRTRSHKIEWLKASPLNVKRFSLT